MPEPITTSMPALQTIYDWVRYATSRFADPENTPPLVFGQGCDNAFDEAHALVLGLLNLPFDLGVSYFQAQLTRAECEKIATAIEARIDAKMPVPYLTNRTLFMGLPFYVDERVLIPRSPIAELIAGDFAPYIDAPEDLRHILDLCCGSGCIGIACASQFPQAIVTVADISAPALAVAEKNIAMHQLAHQVLPQLSDGFDALPKGQYDLIIANPPYVDSETMANLPDEFLHEPAFALGSGEDGLDLTRRILQTAADYLTPNGCLIVEVGASWPLLEAAYPDVVFQWHEFMQGGEGVFVMTADELMAYRPMFCQ
ncbi:50S ribosomal protein L3 N(5)-glutamine methyltransferase [Cardiobacteriales bacterium ML27]|uniref:50S ribosomal protein L3 N(5)-glutamine methyltransferase n=2 Tax=Ostreibacterium oceani TaxID=2654998 RepID=A0A6N7EYN2_9GAMM|nr:50S ribosomal protein L3 N(5)-glutamine methyltransferase [Ostreibacterium oceani]